MRKLLTLCAAVLASFSLWADPTYKSTWSDLTRVEETNYYYTMLNSTNYASYISAGWMSYTGSSTGSATLKINPATDEAISGTSATYGKVKNDGSRYMEFYVTGITSIKFYFANTGSSDRKIQYKLNNGSATDLVTVVQKTSNSGSITLTQNTNNTIRIFSPDNDVFVCAIKVVAPPACTPVTNQPTFGATSTELAITDPNVAATTTLTFTKGSQNLSDPTYVVTKNDEATTDATVEGTTFSATAAGEYVVTATQEEYAYSGGSYCEVSKTVTITVDAQIPVASATIDGPTNAYVGAELTYTATAANADSYQWYVGTTPVEGKTSDTYTFTAAKGSYSISCKARNSYNAAEEWVESNPIALTVTNPSGTLISHTMETGSSSINKDFTESVGTGNVIGGTGHQKTAKNGKLNSECYINLTLASGSFQIGDTVRIIVTPESNKIPATIMLSSKQDNSDIIGQTTGLSTSGSADVTVDVILTKGTSTIWLSRDGTVTDQNPIVKSIAVIRPKDVKSTVESLTAVTINEEEISAANLASLIENKSLDIATSYLNAPEVVFTKHTVITYDDDSQNTKDEDIAVTADVVAGKWSASATINKTKYTVTMAKTASYTVIYKLGETTLGTENVAANGKPAEYETYQTLNDGGLSTFVGWYDNSALTGDAVTMASEEITADATYYAKFTYKYATSINIEQYALDNAKGETNSKALLSMLGTRNYASGITYKSGTNEIDSLRADKAEGDRNYPYLGLKVKTSGAMLNFRLAAGKTVKVKFGNVGTTPKVSINGADYANMTITEKVYTYTAEADALISIKTADANAVVFKQIAIDEEPESITLPALYTVTYNAGEGECATASAFVEYATEHVVLPAATAPQGKKFDGWYDAESEGTLIGVADAEYTPTANITLYAQYSEATALDNTDASVKAVKRIENGMLVIEKNGKVYNIIGAELR